MDGYVMSRQPSEELRELPVFANLPKKSLTMADSLMTTVRFKAGDVLCAEGNYGLQVFIIVNGVAEVTQHGNVIATAKSGDVIGEIALLEKSLRTASVTATEPVTALVMSAGEFISLRALPGIDEAMRKIAADRKTADAATS
jgi:CRP-like cAMP-binding protein